MRLCPKKLFAFSQDQRGQVAMIFALAAVPILMVIGLGLDYSFASRAKAQLQGAADSTALMAVNIAAQKGRQSEASQLASAFFGGSIPISRGVNFDPPTVTLNRTKEGWESHVVYHGKIANAFGSVLRLGETSLSGSAHARIQGGRVMLYLPKEEVRVDEARTDNGDSR